jgi:hypothetical protein
MKVYICNTDDCNNDQLLEMYPCLKEFGFIVEDVKRTARKWIRDENGERIMQEYERTISLPYIFIDSLEDLIKLQKAVDNELVFGPTIDCSDGYFIEIYDGCRE